MNSGNTETQPVIGERSLYDDFMVIARNRITTRQFDPDYEVPKEHYEMILEAARHAPSGANAQPWHYVVVREPNVKQEIADYFVAEQRIRALPATPAWAAPCGRSCRWAVMETHRA